MRRTTVTAVVTGSAMAAGATAEPAEAVPHVAPDRRGTWYIDTQPRALDALPAQVARFTGMSAADCRNVRVVLHGGKYGDEPLRPDENWSGRRGASVRIENSPNGKPVLMSGPPVEGKEHYDREIHSAYPEAAAGERSFSQLFTNGTRQTLVCTPNEGYLAVQCATDTPHRAFTALNRKVIGGCDPDGMAATTTLKRSQADLLHEWARRTGPTDQHRWELHPEMMRLSEDVGADGG